MSGGVKVPVRRGGRDPGLPLPGDEAAVEQLGGALFDRLSAAVARGRAGPAVLAFFEDGVQQVDLGPAIERGAMVVQQLIAATAGQPGCLGVAQLAVLHASRPDRPRQSFATVFIELPDNRWWMRWAPAVAGGGPPAAPRTRAAAEGWPKPNGLGGWFSLARRAGLRLQLEAPGAQAGLHLVH